MRNLKRALSLALASVMLLGMMVVGSSAAFADADEIVNKEAVEITAGLGLFAGSDGKFNPTGTVTRAQMATVIVKMLYGSEINADQFKGTGKFSDTVNFEGGWAEGYINLCANLGIVGGYGDGTFKPGQAVTTAEAVTMIINALGVDAGAGTWPLTVMAKAEEMKLFEELAVKPGTNVALTRDQLASIVLEGIKYSPKGVSGYQVDGVTGIVFKEMADALAAADYDANLIEEVTGEDALWNKVFEVKQMKGFVTANNANDKAADKGVTTILGEEGEELFAIETGADMIGHYVTVFFQKAYENEKEPGQTYCIVDETKVVTVAQADGAIDTRKEYRDAFGSKNLTVDLAYNFDGDMNETEDTTRIDAYVANGTDYNVKNGTYLVYEDEIIGYAAPTTTYTTKVVKVSTTAGKETIKLADAAGTLDNNEIEDEVVEYDGIAKDDLVSYTICGNIYTLAKLEKITGTVTAQTTNKDNGRNILTVNGTKYEYFGGESYGTDLDIVNNEWTVPYNFFNKEIDMYVTAAGKLVGYTMAASAADVSEMIYVVDVYTATKNDAYGNTNEYTYAQGVDMEGKEVNILVNVVLAVNTDTPDNVLKDDEAALEDEDSAINNVLTEADKHNFYTFEKCGEADGNKEGIMTGKVVSAEYHKTNNPVFSGIATGDDDNTELDSKSKLVKVGEDDDEIMAYITENTKFIMTEGSGTQMKIGTAVGSAAIADITDAGVLMSKDASGNVMLEVMVVVADPSGLATDVVYVSNWDLDAKSTGAAGSVYVVYNANTGEKMEITMEDDSIGTEAAGFYKYEYDAEENLYELFTGEGEAITTGNAYIDQSFKSWYNNMLVTDDIVNFDTTNAVIIDTRSEDEIEDSEIEAVEDFEDLRFLVDENGENATVIIDVWTDNAEDEVKVIFVKTIIVPEEEA